MLRVRYVVVDNFVPRELAARMRAEAHLLQRQGEQLLLPARPFANCKL